jgi:hypothetical protein
MSNFFGDQSNRFDDSLPERPEPERQENNSSEPWFVAESDNTNPSGSKLTKGITKRLVTILGSIAGLGIVISLIIWVLLTVLGMYE